jgi:hypothetical protein
MKYFIQEWAKNQNIEVFYFSSFDESWKVKQEGEVGAAWGIWDKNEKIKISKKIGIMSEKEDIGRHQNLMLKIKSMKLLALM